MPLNESLLPHMRYSWPIRATDRLLAPPAPASFAWFCNALARAGARLSSIAAPAQANVGGSMQRIVLSLSLLVLAVGPVAADDAFRTGKPDLRSMSALAFGPEGVLFVGDGKGGDRKSGV